MKKNIIYHFKYIATIALFMALVMSCQDFLEKPQGSDVTIDTVFNSTTNAQQLVSSLYHQRFFGSNNIPLNWWLEEGWHGWSDLGEDMYFPKANWVKHWQYVDGTLSNTSRQFYSLPRLYYAVRIANIFLNGAGSIPIKSEEDRLLVQHMKGEAQAHLAYQYFLGFRLWGSLPWINKPLEGGEEPIPRAPFAELIDSIVSRLDKAAVLLPAKWDDRWTGRFTSVAAKTLKAKVLVYAASALYNGPTPAFAAGYEHPEYLGYGNYDAQRWKRAADACKEAIDAAHAAGHALYNGSGSEKNITHLALNLTEEHILIERWQAFNTVGGWVYCHNQMNWPSGIGWYSRYEVGYQPTIQHVDGYQLKNGKFPISGYTNGDGTQPIISQAGIDAGYVDQEYYKNRDPRFRENIVYHGSTFGESYNTKLINFDIDKTVPNRTHGDWPSFVTSFMVRKFVNEDLGAASTVVHAAIHPILRLADLYLLYAEALNQFNDGPNAEAIQYLNEVRTRSGMPGYDAANYAGASTKEKFQNAIKYERKVEFYLEAQRYFDLRRWKNGSELSFPFAGLTINNGVVSRTDLNLTYVWEDKYYFHPFQIEWVNNTPGLLQNPGY